MSMPIINLGLAILIHDLSRKFLYLRCQILTKRQRIKCLRSCKLCHKTQEQVDSIKLLFKNLIYYLFICINSKLLNRKRLVTWIVRQMQIRLHVRSCPVCPYQVMSLIWNGNHKARTAFRLKSSDVGAPLFEYVWQELFLDQSSGIRITLIRKILAKL